MVLKILILLLCIIGGFSLEIVQYNFGVNFGQVFNDFSLNNNYAVNGLSSKTIVGDTIPTDRGAYFQIDDNNIITLPPNDMPTTGIILQSIFSLTIWINSINSYDSYIFNRVSNEENYFYIKRKEIGNYIECCFSSNSSVIAIISPENSFNNGKEYLGIWQFISLTVRKNELFVNLNGKFTNQAILSTEYNESLGTYTSYIGYKGLKLQSHQGFIWSLSIYNNEAIFQSQNVGSFYNSGNCLVGNCSDSCDPSIVISGIHYCLPVNVNNNTNAAGINCYFCPDNIGCSDSICLTCSCYPINSCILNNGSSLCLNSTQFIVSSGSDLFLLRYLRNMQAISNCNPECTSCTGSSLCSACIDNNASPNKKSPGCICKSKYWGTPSTTSSSGCQSCLAACATCANATTCSTCSDANAYTDSTSLIGCTCNEGYYWATYTPCTSTCYQCNQCNIDCLSCSSSYWCDICIDSNSASIMNVGRMLIDSFVNTYSNINSSTKPSRAASTSYTYCNCKPGYWGVYPLSRTSICYPCNSDCATCGQANICLTCNSKIFVPSIYGGCACADGTYLNGEACSSCNSNCLTCNNATSCVTCVDINSYPIINGSCLCNPGYSLNSDLKLCIQCTINTPEVDCNCHPLCIKCYGSSNYNCFSCLYNSLSGVCVNNCPLGYTSVNKICVILNDNPAPVTQFLFQSVGDCFFDSANGLTICTATNSTSRRLLDISNPITCYLRGVYFPGGASLVLNSTTQNQVLGNIFSISVWINPQVANGIIIYRDYSSNCLIAIGIQSLMPYIEIFLRNSIYTYTSTIPIILNKWNNILFTINYSSQTTITLYTNRIITNPQSLSNAPYQEHISSNLFIASDSNLNNFYTGFIYEIEIYPYILSIDYITSSVCNGCFVCEENGYCIPNCNISYYYSQNLTECLQCPPQCSNGCLNSTTCNLCADYKCVKCTNFRTNSCTQCEPGYEVVNSLCVLCNSTSFYDSNSLTCKACEGLCYTCNSPTICTSCVQDSYVINNTQCTCNLGYSGTTACERNFFTVSLEIDQDNNVTLLFSEPLQNSLTASSIVITVDSNKLDFTIKESNSSVYIVTVDFISYITDTSTLNITFVTNIVSAYNSLLFTTSLTTKLYINNDSLENKLLAARAAAAKAIAKSGVAVGLSGAVVSSLLSFSPTSLFDFMNTAEILGVVILFNMDLYPVLSSFLLGAQTFSIIPNIFSFFINQNEGVALPQKDLDYGNSTNLFLLNDGNQIFIFILFLLILFALLLLSLKTKFKTKLRRPLAYFKYGFFLRFLIQNYLNSLITTAKGIRYTRLDNTVQIVDFCFCIMFIVKFI